MEAGADVEVWQKQTPYSVIPGLEPGIHAFCRCGAGVGPRIKPEDDGVWGGFWSKAAKIPGAAATFT
ncbi:hypothetical protein CO674_13890 [Rhizobium hidalgonense]|uniref:Uncharacterized protein n=1 Tax=Rhizobium hidalgonense TaxID=1538159 RepID=A0ABX4JWE3_9HYPH|nr:hypothetical protein CO674_13890 [Rhizobium hidalgonense]PON01280.1 hypothetical protein ATY29_34365 [Rhizobium hidalgonense]